MPTYTTFPPLTVLLRIVLTIVLACFPRRERSARLSLAHFCLPSPQSIYAQSLWHLAQILRNFLHSSTYIQTQLRPRFSFSGLEHIPAGHAPAILAGAHIGDWQLVLCAMRPYFPQSKLFAKYPAQPWVRRFLLRRQASLDIPVILYEEGIRAPLKALQSGLSLAFAFDTGKIGPRDRSVPITFLGQNVTANPAIALLARAAKVPILPILSLHDPSSGQHHCRVYPPIHYENDPCQTMQTLFTYLEDVLRQDPAQYLWLLDAWDLNPES
jgi:lauroyl/myristoyl acyltransferase